MHQIGLQRTWQLWLLRAKTVCLYAVCYAAVDFGLNKFAFHDAWNIVWPLNGVTVGLLVTRPRSEWPWLLIGVELGSGIGETYSFDDNALPTETCQRTCSFYEVVISALMLPHFQTLESWLRTPRIFSRFAAALLLGPGISGLLAAALFHYQKGQSFVSAFNDWATADALGIAATAPLVISLYTPEMRRLFTPRAMPATIAVLLFAWLAVGVIFSVSRFPLIFLLYPLLLLVDFLLAFAGSAIAVVGILLISMYLTIHSLGTFGVWSSATGIPRNLALQLYFGFHILALFPASMLSMERRRMTKELHESNARLTILATLDGLTGIANRRYFNERLENEWHRAIRQREPIALAMIDLDNFKQFNDIYGHVAGDNCLRAVAEVLGGQLRRPDDLAARFGGEEFAVLLPNTDGEGIAAVAERIRNAVHELAIVHLGNTWNFVTVSIGYSALVPANGDGQSSIIQLADAALYQAKRIGRNRVETIASVEGLKAANDHFGDTTSIRLLRIFERAKR